MEIYRLTPQYAAVYGITTWLCMAIDIMHAWAMLTLASKGSLTQLTASSFTVQQFLLPACAIADHDY